MNTEKVVIFIHGMGTHTAESMKNDFIDNLDNELKKYPSANEKKIEDVVDVKLFRYDNVFESYRNQVKENAGLVGEAIKGLSGATGLITDGIALANKLDQRITEDSAFSTHWFDVILYYFTLLAEPIRIKLAIEINTAVNKVGAANVHIVAHSLGCILLHDTLEKLYGSATLKTEANLKKLNVTSNKLGSINMVSNVSRVLQTFSKVRESIVRPGLNGCTHYYTEYRHKLDPIAQIKSFDPTDNDNWVSHADFNRYKLVQPSSVTDANTHSLEHYIKNPMVHLELFKRILRYRPRTKAEREAVEAEYLKNTLSQQASNLQQQVDGLDITSKKSLNSFFSAAIDFKDFVTGFKESFK